MKQWFQNCSNEAEIKSAYRAFAKEHHPDMGGDTATMQEINAQYESALKFDYRRQGYDEAKAQARWEMDEEIARKAQEIIKLSNELKVEVCGVWLWVTGNTRAYAAQLKTLACRWSPKKVAWYFRREIDGGRRFHTRHYSLEEIRAKYGSHAVAREEQQQQFAGITA